MPETAEQGQAPLLKTKLHCPLVPRDFVHRPRLHERMDQGFDTPLTLVSAPAGYGKSLMVGDWVQSREVPCAWLSLDASDSDLPAFLDYLLATVESLFPNSHPQTRLLMGAPEPSPMPVLASSLANELDALDTPFALVLDDYHRIDGTPEVHELLRQLLAHPPQPLHLVLISRRDPPLGLTLLRAQGQLTDVRLKDLRFTLPETKELLEKTLGFTASVQALAKLQREIEGWPVGLRLLSLTLRQNEDPDGLFKKLRGDVHTTREYLFQEVLALQAPQVRNRLLQISILDRFCAPLCEAVCLAVGRSGVAEFSGAEFLQTLQERNLFAVPLDSHGEWFRYHHLFQNLLQTELERCLAPAEIARLHARASRWFEERGLIEDAIRHALKGGDRVAAAEIVDRHRGVELNEDRWNVIQRWLALFPADFVEQRPSLMLAQAWIAKEQHRLPEVAAKVAQVEACLDGKTIEPALLSELNLFRGVLQFWTGNGESSRRCLEETLAQVSDLEGRVRADAEFFLAVALQMVGEEEKAFETLEEKFRAVDSPNDLLASRLIGVQIHIHLLSAEFELALQVAHRLRMLMKGHNPFVSAWIHYLEAKSQLQLYRLDEALQGFLLATKRRDILYTRAAVDAMLGLILSYQAAQRPDDAVSTMNELLEFARETGNVHHVAVAQSFQARLALLQGELDRAIQWARSYSAQCHAPSMVHWLEIPDITLARVLVATGSDESLQQASALLATLRQATEGVHNTCQTIEIRVLQTVTLGRQGRIDEAVDTLKKTLNLARPRRCVRPFVEAGPPMADLLERLVERQGRSKFARRLLEVLTGAGRELETRGRLTPTTEAGGSLSLAEALTAREFDILDLLTQRLRNKEIAHRLSISEETVKTHLKHLYQKLGVGNRRQAAVRAEELRPLLSPRGRV